MPHRGDEDAVRIAGIDDEIADLLGVGEAEVGSDAATSIAPTDDISDFPSVMLRHVWPPLFVFQTPPFTAPNQATIGLVGSPATASTRPPRNGPTSLHRNALKRSDVADGFV